MLLLLVCILSISAISATQDTVNKQITSTDDNIETNIQYDDVSISNMNDELILEENNGRDEESGYRTDKTIATNEDPLTFTELNKTINDNTNSTIYLSKNYKYNNEFDAKFINGISISRDLTIYGNGVTLDGSNLARIFNVISDFNVNFYNITFINGNSENGGAIYGGNAYNCTFIENKAGMSGGAIYRGNATNCTFTQNNATSGGAISDGNAYNCTFTENNATLRGGAIYNGNATNCTFTQNNATDLYGCGGAISDGNAYNCTFTGNTATRLGGAISQGNATNCTFTGNTATLSGGAIYNGNATNCTFTQNNAASGGAISQGNATNCTFTQNNATSGGAIYNGTATNCTFTNNTATGLYGCGGAISDGNAYNCTFTGNTATRLGGAIYNGTATNCTFTQNNATSGGAISDGNAYNCTFTGNTAPRLGGAIYNGTATNCTFTQNNARSGGAISDGNAYNCTFTNNTSTDLYGRGGAISDGNAYNCTFTQNNATSGGAMYGGNAILCTFNGDTTYNTNIIPAIINVINYTSPYMSGERLKFNLTADNMDFDGFNTTIEIYKDDLYVTTVYGLTGEGWIVDLIPGEYTAVLSLTDYTEEWYKSSNATITVLKENTTVVINPITNIKVGDEVTITYNTNSNGTVTIKVNGQIIHDGKFTPTYEGTYNVTIEVAENEYYTAATNQTNFTAEKLSSQITAKPVTTTYNIAKNLIITLKDSNGKAIKGAILTVNLGSSKKYTTDANGQVKINVATLTPKTYNAKITYAGSDIYNGSTGSAKVIVKKANPKITAKSAIFKLKVKTKKYTATFKNNKNQAIKNTKVTLKVGGKTYSVKTNSKGQATFKITNLKKIGSYIAVITFPTNKYYNKVAKKVKITVKR